VKIVILAEGAAVRTCESGLKSCGEGLHSDSRGRYRVIDLEQNVVVDENADLAQLAADLDCIRPWEEVRFWPSSDGRPMVDHSQMPNLSLSSCYQFATAGSRIACIIPLRRGQRSPTAESVKSGAP